MIFARPEALALLLLLPLLGVWIARGRRLAARGWEALGQGGEPRSDGAAGWLAACACLVVALAQPRWGRLPAPPLPPGHDVVLLIDTSRSMAAGDAVPSRLSVAIEAAGSLVAALGQSRGDRAAVVAFAGRGRLRCPLTGNLGAVAEALRSLRPGDVRPGGTDLRAGLDAALDAFDDQEHAEGRTIVVFSDGEDLAGDWPRAVERLRPAGVLVHTVAIGDPEHGHLIPSGRGSEPLMYHGAPVRSRRTDPPLRTLAAATGGAFVPLGLASADLGSLYQTRIAPVARRNRAAARLPDRAERFPLFLLATLALGLAGSWRRGMAWKDRRRRGAVLGVLLAATLGTLGAGPDDLVAQGQAAYHAGRFEEALQRFEQARTLDPTHPVLVYDTAAALFQLGRFAEALDHYQAARSQADPALRARIDYALGNTALALGGIPEAIAHYRACLASTAPDPAVALVRHDAALNLAFAQKQLYRPAPPPREREQPQTPSSNRQQQPQSDHAEPPPQPPTPGAAPPPKAPPRSSNSPRDRLDEALDHIREAQRRRLTDQPPPADDRLKDW